jgi:hypothetical protein
MSAALLEAFELHSEAGIRRALATGVSVTALIDGKRPIDLLIEMYTRSTAFAPCLQVLLDAGAALGDPLLEAVLLDAPSRLPDDIHCRLSFLNGYTACRGVTALHVCAEFNSVHCARVLLERGADVNARAQVDAMGFGGHTPIFHCVNSNQNYCRPMLDLLVAAGADLSLRVDALLWGEQMDWETAIFDVTPISYAQCGLYRQFHRRETDVFANVDLLHRVRHGRPAPIRNVPNRYLQL